MMPLLPGVLDFLERNELGLLTSVTSCHRMSVTRRSWGTRSSRERALMDEIKAGLSEAERDTLKAVWDHGPGTVRQFMELLAEGGHRWSYSTVATLLRRLEAKGYTVSE